MDYSVHLLARSEYELMAKSLLSVPDFDTPFPPEPPRWARLLEKLRSIAAIAAQAAAANPPNAHY